MILNITSKSFLWVLLIMFIYIILLVLILVKIKLFHSYVVHSHEKSRLGHLNYGNCKWCLKWYSAYLKFLPLKVFVKVVYLVNIIRKCLIKVNFGMLKKHCNYFIVIIVIVLKLFICLMQSIFLLLLMIIVENHRFIFLSIKVKPLVHLRI